MNTIKNAIIINGEVYEYGSFNGKDVICEDVCALQQQCDYVHGAPCNLFELDHHKCFRKVEGYTLNDLQRYVID